MYLLIGERTRTRAHTRRNSVAVFHLRIFGFSASEIFCCFLMTYRHLLSEHLASTGKQSDPTLRLVMTPRCRKTRWLERVGHRPACAHGDTACFRILTESGIMLWRHQLLHDITTHQLTHPYPLLYSDKNP